MSELKMSKLKYFGELVAANNLPRLTESKEELLEYLTEKDAAAIQHKCLSGVTLMHVAAEHGRIEAMEFLLKECNMSVNSLDVRKGGPMLEAAAKGKLEAMSWLHGHGADVHASDDRGDTALHIAAGCGNLECVKCLLETYKCDVDTKTALGVTPLLYATAKGRVKVMQCLVQHGGDPFAVDDARGWSSVHIAAACNQPQALRWLVTKFPKLLEQRTARGLSVEAVAIQERSMDSYLECKKIIKEKEREMKKIQLKSMKEKAALEKQEANKKAAEEAEKLLRELDIEREPKTKNKKKKKQKLKNEKKKEEKVHTQQPAIPAEDDEDPAEDDAGPAEDDEGPESTEIVEEEKDVDVFEMRNFQPDVRVEDDLAGEWEVKVSRKTKKQQKKMASESNKAKLHLKNKPEDKKMKSTETNKKKQNARLAKKSVSNNQTDDNQQKEVQKKKTLCPNACPWSPRRKRWPQDTKKTWNVNIIGKDIVNKDSRQQASDRIEEKSKVDSFSRKAVESEFNRMLKKFVHMDQKARITARRRFAKAAKLHEENRLAEAEKMETSWKISLKTRLATSLMEKSVEQAAKVIAEIENAKEERTLHLQKLKGEVGEDIIVPDIISGDTELAKLVDKARQLINIPLKWRTTKDVENDKSEGCANPNSTVSDHVFVSLDSSKNFEKNLEESMQLWSELGVRRVQLELTKSLSECIPVAVNKDFDFENAKPGLIVLSKTL